MTNVWNGLRRIYLGPRPALLWLRFSCGHVVTEAEMPVCACRTMTPLHMYHGMDEGSLPVPLVSSGGNRPRVPLASRGQAAGGISPSERKK